MGRNPLYLIIALALLFIIVLIRINLSKHHPPIRDCYESEKSIYPLYRVYDNSTGSMNINSGTDLYYDKNKKVKVNDIIIANNSEVLVAHRVDFNILDAYYIANGDNNFWNDKIYIKEDIKGVVICQDE